MEREELVKAPLFLIYPQTSGGTGNDKAPPGTGYAQKKRDASRQLFFLKPLS